MRNTKYMKTLAVLAIACAGSLKAELGETPAQFETGQPTEVKHFQGNITAMIWAGKSVTHFGVFDGSNRCVSETFWFADGRQMVLADFERFLAPYSDMSVLNKSRDERGIYQFLGKNGKVIAVAAYFHEDNRLSVMTLPFWNSTLGKTTKDQDAPQPVVAQPSSSTPNDCLVVATEVYGRLRTSAHWARIIAFRLNDGKETVGHAVVLYQPTPTSNVWLYDKTIGGSKDIGTQSHDLAEIVNSIESLTNDGIIIEEPHWID